MRDTHTERLARVARYTVTKYTVVCPSCDMSVRVVGAVAAAQIVATHEHETAVAEPRNRE